MGVKASGGIHTREMAEALAAAGANRLGTSATLAIVEGKYKARRRIGNLSKKAVSLPVSGW